MKVEIIIPEEYYGAIVDDVYIKRDRILEEYKRGNAKIVLTWIPFAHMFDYLTSLRNLTQGRESF